MKIQSKSFIIFEIAVIFITAIIMTLSLVFFPIIQIDAAKPNLTDCFALASIPTLVYAIFSVLVWRLWNGKKWYSLSLYYLYIFVILLLVLFVSDFIFSSSSSYLIGWGLIICLIIYVIFLAPAHLVNIIIIGIVGKFILKKFH